MKRALQRVQRAFWAALGSCLLAAGLAFPHADDAHLVRALKELRAFQASFDFSAQQRRLEREATERGGETLGRLAELVKGPGAAQVTAQSPTMRMRVQPRVELRTLAAVEAMSSADATVPVTGPRAARVADSLRWRLARSRAAENYQLGEFAWSPGGASRGALELEFQVEPARRKVLTVRRAYLIAERERETAKSIYDTRRKKGASRKRIRRAWQKLAEVRSQVPELRAALEESRAKYQELAAEAWAFSGEDKQNPARAAQGRGVAVATFRRLPDGDTLRFRFPVNLEQRRVKVAPLASHRLHSARALEQWSELKTIKVAEAVDRVASGLSWHYRTAKVAGLSLGGPTLLHMLPAILAAVLGVVIFLCRQARLTYNPFEPQAPDLPKVGSGSSVLDCVMLFALPAAASALCVWSLARLECQPFVALSLSTGALGLALWCCIHVTQLKRLRDDVRRTSRISQAPDLNLPS